MSESEETQSSVPSTSDNSVENQPQASPSDPLNKRTEEEMDKYVAEEEDDERRWNSRTKYVKRFGNPNERNDKEESGGWFFKNDDEWSFQYDHEDD